MKRFIKILLIIAAGLSVAVVAQQGISLNSSTTFPLDI